jgi:uncharacterized membrane protein
MSFSPLLLFHISAGVVVLLSGSAAMLFRKGSHRHKVAGNVYVVSMLCLATTGTYLGIVKRHVLNTVMGVLACYLVVTAWRTARRRSAESGMFAWGALMIPIAAGATLIAFSVAVTAGLVEKHGYPVAVYLIFGCAALLLAVGDVRMLTRGSLFGTQRIARHLLRMCFSLFIAAASLFEGQPQVFPAVLRKTGLLLFASSMPLMLMIFWLFRVRMTRASERMTVPREDDVYSLRT